MPNIVIFVSYDSDSAPGGKVQLQCRSRASGVQQDIGFYCVVDLNNSAAQINAAITTGAVEEFARANPPIIVAGNDRKVIMGGAV